MSGIVAGIGFVLTLVVVILIHEAAHFFMAKRFDIKVEEYFVGFGPRLWSTWRGETEYGIKAIILGGYVKIAGMNPFVEPAEGDLPRTFGAKAIWQRAMVIVAGPLTHFMLAFVALFLYLALVGQPSRYAAQIGAIEPKLNGATSPAAAAGLRPGDVIVSVDGTPVDDEAFVKYTRQDTGGVPLTLVVDRDGKSVTLTATPVPSEVGSEMVPRLGVLMSPGRVIARDRPGLLGSLPEAGALLWRGTGEVFHSFARVFGPEGISRLFRLLFGGAHRSVEDPFSLVGGARIAGQVAESGQFDAFVALFVSFNIFIGILNLIPLPPFDGGHLAVLAVEKMRGGKKVDMRKLIPVSAVVAGLLIAFMLAVVYLDFVKPIPNLFP